jgi:excinuclease ABC subunit C
MDALLLENSLIKKHQPKYNVQLKDGKTYPWICIEKHPLPKIYYTRKIDKKDAEYFGPFASVHSVKFLIKLIKELYPFLNHDLNHLLKKDSNEKIVDQFEENIKSIRSMIKGNFQSSINKFKSEMRILSSIMKFEEANEVKEKLQILLNYQAKSTIVSPKINNLDVFSIISDKSYAFVNFLQVSFGSIVASHTMEIKKRLNESDEEILRIAIIEIKQRFFSNASEICLPFKINLGDSIKVTIPKTGDKKSLVDLSLRNAKFFRIDKLKQIKIIDPEAHLERIISQVKLDLKLNNMPYHIECFDNSNLNGTNPVSACVVFKNAKPSKRDYRLYKINDIEGPDDFASMEQVVYRRLNRLVEEKNSLPDLVIVDGGKGQLSAGLKSIVKLRLENKVAIIGIAKRLEEIFIPGDKLPLYINKTSETLKLIQQLRNEAHRFAINFHRKQRSKDAFDSQIDNLDGVGPKTSELLLTQFKSFKRIQQATEKDLIELLGNAKGKSIFKQLKS